MIDDCIKGNADRHNSQIFASIEPVIAFLFSHSHSDHYTNQCYQYMIILRETDLHKFFNLFLNPIQHCLSIYIGLIVC
jgi:phosphoribosyl 1,2-cyclic phosphodiesterase